MRSGLNPTGRFSNRVDDYVRYRPGYPREVVALLQRECGLGPRSAVADLGSGTGIFARLLLSTGCRVFGIEPNEAMRLAGEHDLAGESRFVSVNGTAEATSLANQSVDLITAAQAFHWFDQTAARIEIERILRPGGWLCLIWNERQTDSTPFLRDYEQLLRTHCPEYPVTDHKVYGGEALAAFFAPGRMMGATLANEQVFDLAGLSGRLLSSSYAPPTGKPGHDEMMTELQQVYDQHQQDGRVQILYDTLVYYGRLS